MNIITRIEVGKRNKERVNVFIDDEFAFSISAELVYKENLEIKQTVDKEKLSRLAEADNIIKCKSSALKIVERSYKTEKEIVDKLVLKGYEHSTINKTLEFLKEYNFLNDEAYTKMYIKDKVKTQGKNKIKYSLMRKGISDELISTHLTDVNEGDLRDVAFELALKKYNVLKKRENDKFKLSQKLYRFLVTKGYDYDLVSEVIKKVIKTEENN